MGRTRKKGQNITGWLVLDKPLGMTSTQSLGKVRWLLDAKKAGHAGTLDPLASGVLPLAFGEATKTIAFMMDARKTYEFTVRWGLETSTLDTQGEEVARSPVRPSAEEITRVLPDFMGEIMQMPPIYSALKVDGRRAYDLARAGEDVVLKARPVRIDDLRLLNCPSKDEACFEVRCGKGTYVRSLARDLAFALGTKGHVSALRRTGVGPFTLDEAITLPALEGAVARDAASALLQPLARACAHLPTLDVDAAQAADLHHGRAIALGPRQALADQALVYAQANGNPIAIGTIKDGRFQPKRVFNL